MNDTAGLLQPGMVDRLDADPEVRLTGLLFGRAYNDVPHGAWRAPGGLTLLGGSEGALTVALPWGVIVVAAPLADGRVELYSMNHHAEQLALRPGERPADLPAWALPCVRAADAAPRHAGIRMVVNRELPAEMGLLSGAETFCTVSLALRDLYGLNLSAADPDPSYAASLHGRARKALLVRGRSSVGEHVPFDLMSAGLRLLVMDVGVGVAPPGTEEAGDAGAAAAALRAGKPSALGPLLTEGHRPGVEILDLALQTALDAGALGGRAVGPCAVALVPMTAVPKIRATVTARLAGVSRRPPRFLTAVSADGARRVA